MKAADQLRLLRRKLREDSKKFEVGVFVEIPRSEWPSVQQTVPLRSVFRSKNLLVQIFEGQPTRLSISKIELRSDGNWADGITWDELQECKDRCGFSMSDAVEAFPVRKDIVNVANVRHLWIMPKEMTTFFWRSQKGSGFKSGETAEQILIP